MHSDSLSTKTPTPRTRTTRGRARSRALAATLPGGTRIGAYEVLDVIGRGGMGVVYKAYHGPLEREVAIKVLKAFEHDPQASKRFEREARTSAKLRHPNILNVFDYGEFEGSPYMVTEYLPGGTLADRLRQQPAPDLPETMTLLRGIAAALDFAHSQAVIHRDVKPGNILLDEKGNPILADFGLAKVLRESTMHTTGVPTGTPAYVAPEQITEGEVGSAADRYSFAVMAYQLVTGRLPFEARDFMKALYAHVQQQPAIPTDVRPDLPAAVDAVLLRGLAKSPGFRWPTCGEMVDALEPALKGAFAATSPEMASHQGDTPTARITEYTGPSWWQSLRFGAEQKHPLQGSFVSATAFGVGVLLFVGLAAILRPPAATAPSLDISARPVHAGQSIRVAAAGLPQHQQVDFYLDGRAAPIGHATSSADGTVLTQPAIPADTAAGAHQLKLCWRSTCPLHADLTVSLPAPPAKHVDVPSSDSMPVTPGTGVPSSDSVPVSAPTPPAKSGTSVPSSDARP